jgi:small subunit ribosomal protein S3Ae
MIFQSFLTMAKVKKVGIKKKKKSWFNIISPKSFGSVELGETLAVDKAAVVGKNITMNLSLITKSGKDQKVNMSFVVEGVKEDKAHTKAIGFKLEPSYVKRMARKGKSKIANSFNLKSKDDIDLVLKVLIITKTKITRGVRADVHHACKKYVEEQVTKYSFENLLGVVVSKELQVAIKKELSSKVYPLSTVVIKEVKLK